MARSPVYTTHGNVSALLQVADFDTDTTPTSSEVDAFIMRAEDYIETETRKAWRAVSVSDEYHDYWGVTRVPLYTRYNAMRWGTSYVKAAHRPIQSLTSGTHSIEVWDGSEWKDLVLDANGYTEGRGDDYYLDYEMGVIYFEDVHPTVGSNTVRLTYDYGYSEVGLEIEDAATKLAAIEVVLAQDKTVLIAEGGGYAPLPIQKIGEWKERVENVLARHREIVSVTR